METQFKDVAHLYKGVIMKTAMGNYPLIAYHNGEWLLDCIEYGQNAVEQDIKPYLNRLPDITEEHKQQFKEIVGLEEEDLDCLTSLGTAHLTNVYQWALGVDFLRKNYYWLGYNENFETGDILDLKTLEK